MYCDFYVRGRTRTISSCLAKNKCRERKCDEWAYLIIFSDHAPEEGKNLNLLQIISKYVLEKKIIIETMLGFVS